MTFKYIEKGSLFVVFFILICSSVSAQNYVDILKIDYTNIFNSNYKNSNEKTDVGITNLSLVYPIKLNEKIAIISGVDYNNHNLALYPSQENTSISNITLKAGLSIKHSNKISGTYVVLPRRSSENLHDNGNDFFIGGIALLKYQRTKIIK